METTMLKERRIAGLRERSEEIMRAQCGYWQEAVDFICNPREKGTAVAFPETTAYLFNTNGIKWMIDPVYHYGFASDEEITNIASILRDFSFGIITHGHADHFQPALLEKLTESDIKWIACRSIEKWVSDSLPDFPEEKIIWMEEHEDITLSDIRIVCLPGMHAEDGKPFVPSAAYAVFLPDGTSLLFLGDCRNFSLPKLPSGCFDYVFGHVYLGRADNTLDDFPHLNEFSRMLLSANPGTVFLTHLYDLCRAPEDMWTERHAEMVRSVLLEICPNLNVHILIRGGNFYLKFDGVNECGFTRQSSDKCG